MTDLEELRRLAEAATPGPWMERDGELFRDGYPDEYDFAHVHRVADAAYIAAANPATILALLDRIEAYEKAQAATYRVVEDLNRSRSHD